MAPSTVSPSMCGSTLLIHTCMPLMSLTTLKNVPFTPHTAHKEGNETIVIVFSSLTLVGFPFSTKKIKIKKVGDKLTG